MTTTRPAPHPTRLHLDCNPGPPPPFDPELAAALEVLNEQLPSALLPEMITAMRSGLEMLAVSDDDLRRDGAFEIQERTVPGPVGAPDISLLICRPTGAAIPAGSGLPHPWRRDDPGRQSHRDASNCSTGRRNCSSSSCRWSTDWRRKHPHPAPVEDCYAGLVWTAEHADELGIDPDRIIIAGASAGGGLAAGVGPAGPRPRWTRAGRAGAACARCSTTATTPRPAGRWPGSGSGTRHRTTPGGRPCSARIAAAPMSRNTRHRPGKPTSPGCRPRSSTSAPRRPSGTRTSPTPPAIWQAGGVAELHVWPGGFHGFDGMVPQAAVSQDAKAARVRWLRRILGS